jgi:hypothetical protein
MNYCQECEIETTDDICRDCGEEADEICSKCGNLIENCPCEVEDSQ